MRGITLSLLCLGSLVLSLFSCAQGQSGTCVPWDGYEPLCNIPG